VLRALGQRGCRSGWTVSNFRGRARLHITARAGDGHRKQLLLPYPWESDQLEAIRDGVVTVYEAFQNGAPLELAIAELGAAKAEAEARRQAEALASQPSNLEPSVPPPATASRPISIDWAGLIRRYQQHKLRSGEIKESTWERLYKPRMALVLKTAKGPSAARDATQLLEAQADLWSQRPGCRTRRLQIHYTAALLRWAVSQRLLPVQWAPPPDLSTIIGRSRESRAVTTPIAVPDILAMVQAVPDQRRRYAFQLLRALVRHSQSR
jgi:plasmid stabilization system protein ParE